ncbi:MAG: hypothetical protein A3C79_03140 [Candidatus Taylorbacteria bacterium RIFCSPHIGHO2_02_FULL_45_28]|nr:MAG: hypothetical protein A3C79_03140 [Candidatus Taylorbacteria bacterium RIFCSPHIGHO2_02_FULL_45_28]
MEKATELGVTKIIPIMAERSEKKNLNEERLKKIAVEASEQSGRGTVPEIEVIISLEEAVQRLPRGSTSVAFHTEGKPLPLPIRGGTSVLFIGPEGGWSPKEIEMFHANKIPIFTFGKQVLRSETAVVVTLAKILL